MGLITSRELVNRHNISYQTLNYYTTIGLLKIRARVGSLRLYDEELTKNRLEKIVALKVEGYPLRIIIKELAKEVLQDPRIAANPVNTEEQIIPKHNSNHPMEMGMMAASYTKLAQESHNINQQSRNETRERKGSL